MSTPEATVAVTAGSDCEHVLHEWPLTGPWIDYTCMRCGDTWRIPWRPWMACSDPA